MSTLDSAAGAPEVLLHGWDAHARSWHGPIALDRGVNGRRMAPAKMRNIRGPFHFGKFRCSVAGLPPIEFSTALYDRPYGGLAIAHLDGPSGGPVAVLSVLPVSRRQQLRTDFALELMTLVALLSAPVNDGAEVSIHDYIEETLHSQAAATHVYALETAALEGDLVIVLAAHLEWLAAAMLDWMEERQTSIQSDAPAAIPSAGCDTREYDIPTM